jgi:phage terminase large subunit-like protein
MTTSPLPSLQSLPPDRLAALESALRIELERRKARNKLATYAPYAKQREFHAAGKVYRERLLMAANQVGKSFCGASEVAMHLTGRYPDWWEGRVFQKPPRGWAASVTAEVTRDGAQRLLVGEPKNESVWGTGLIPADALNDWGRRQGVKDALDYVTVKWGGGGDVSNYATLGFKSYDQGREKFQAETLDFAWPDEECGEDIYTGMLTRTNATGGMLFMTFTPLFGVSNVVARFIMPKADDPARASRHVTSITIDDAEHYSAEVREQIIASYPEHEREARTKGVPSLGSGRVFPVTEESIACDAIPIPKHWARINGVDFGWDHPFAAVSLAWDRDADVVYVVHAYRESKQTPPIHAAAIKPWGSWIPCAWPHDGFQHDKGSGKALRDQYAEAGLKMLTDQATFDDGGNGVEAGIMDMLARMQTGRLKVFRHLSDWFEEFRLYRRDKGRIVKERDDLMAATRYALMMLRKAKTQPDPRKAADPDAGGGAGSWMS